MTVWFTSDLHFHHKNIIQFCPKYRSQFNNVEEMNKGLIKQWNETVKKDDIVYNLGDFSFSRNINEIIAMLKALNGEHHLILGNHDQLITKHRDMLLNTKKRDGHPLLSSIQHYLEITLNKQEYILFHYPISEWNKAHHGSIHLYGHIHDKDSPLKGKLLNVGIDKHCYLLSEQDILNKMKNKEVIKHHS